MNENPQYYSWQRSELLPFVPGGISTTLDVGCGEGVFSAGLKKKFNTEAWGLEMVEDAAALAASKLDEVLIGTFEEAYDRLPKKYFDCIFFNDVLEHMVDPYQALRISKELLSKDGVIICSIPNVRWFPNLIELLVKRDWRYRDAGILDRTHLRFFTLKSIQRMFSELGFEVIELEGIHEFKSLKMSLAYQFCNMVTLGLFRDSRYMQYACVVKPASMEKSEGGPDRPS